MLTLVPQALCTSNFRVLGLNSGEALLTYSGGITEQGTITFGGIELAVIKHGVLSHWSLERFGESFAQAQKLRALSNAFDLICGEVHLTIKEHPDGFRCFDIRSGDSVVGTIRPVHPLTRRAIIRCGDSVSDLAQLFAFWIVARHWRRWV